MKQLFTVVIILLISSFASAQTDDLKFSGGVQLRSELDGRDFSNQTHAILNSSIRTRLGVMKKIENFTFFAQFQDSRLIGQEGSTSTDLKNVDLHQGYVLLDKPFNLPLSVQAGRFEMIYGSERFIGASNWSLTGRAFDGARFSFNFTETFKTDLFAVTIKETNPLISNATPGAYVYPLADDNSVSVYGIWNQITPVKNHKFDVFGYWELDRSNNSKGEDNLSRMTIGASHNGNFDGFYDVIEGAVQLGSISGMDISAYLFSAQLGYNADPFKAGAGIDMYSGQDFNKTDKYGTFTTGLGTGHKYLGYMDYFINIPSNTAYMGVNDIYGTLTYAPKESKLSLNLMFHHFMTNSDVDDNAYGQELDLTVKYEFIKNVNLQWGGSIFMPADLMKAMYKTSKGPREDTAFWSYLMISATF